MHPKKAFKFCPKCRGKLAVPKGNMLQCSICHFRLYINPIPTNGVVIANNKGDILLVKRAFEPGKGAWDVPGGFIQPQESIDASVKRELKEELGIDACISRFIGIYTDTYLFDGVINYTMCIMVVADIVSGNITPADDAESYAYFPKSEILRERIAFEGVRKGLVDYMKFTTSLPSFTA